MYNGERENKKKNMIKFQINGDDGSRFGRKWISFGVKDHHEKEKEKA